MDILSKKFYLDYMPRTVFLRDDCLRKVCDLYNSLMVLIRPEERELVIGMGTRK
jgi:hypothetical protein